MTSGIILPPHSKSIPLTKGKHTIVDESDYEWLSQWKWHCCNGYAMRAEYKNGDRKTINMHRVILQPPDNLYTDHINCNKLDNRRQNLRACTNQENHRNMKSRTGTSIYKGVYWHKKARKWAAGVTTGSKRLHLGLFSEEDKAALAYNKAATKYFGEFARLNVLPVKGEQFVLPLIW